MTQEKCGRKSLKVGDTLPSSLFKVISLCQNLLFRHESTQVHKIKRTKVFIPQLHRPLQG